MGKLRDRMIQDLRLAGYSPSTRRIYLLYATKFAQHFRRSPEILGEREVRRYFLHLLDERQLSHDAYRQAYAALKFLYTVTLKRPFDLPCIPRKRSPRPLPDVLSGSEVRRLIEAFRIPKYRMATMTLYGAGLRVSEACRLRPRDIDSRRMLIHVRLGKGRKDRFVTLSRRLLDSLRVYWRMHRPQDFFNRLESLVGKGRCRSRPLRLDRKRRRCRRCRCPPARGWARSGSCRPHWRSRLRPCPVMRFGRGHSPSSRARRGHRRSSSR